MSTQIEQICNAYKKRIHTYMMALAYDQTDRGSTIRNAYYTAAHKLQRYLVQQHATQGFTDVMAHRMYDTQTGGALKAPSGYSYINAERYPELGRLHNEAENARRSFNNHTRDELSNYLARISELKLMIEGNYLPSSIQADVQAFVDMEDRIREIRDNSYFEICENGKWYDEQIEKREDQYKNNFAKAHPGYERDRSAAYRTGGTALQIGGRLQEVDKRYGFVPYQREGTAIRSACGIFFKAVPYREEYIIEAQRKYGDVEIIYRGIDLAIKEAFPSYSPSERADFWRRYFGVSIITYY